MAQGSGEIGQTTGRAQGSSADPAAAAPTTDEIRSHIEQTRTEMSHTIDAIQARLSPRRLISDTKETVMEATVGRMKRLTNRATHNRGDSISGMRQIARANPIPVAAAGITAVAVLLRAVTRSRRRRHADTKDHSDRPVRRKSKLIVQRKARMLAGACAGLAWWGAVRARRSVAPRPPTAAMPADDLTPPSLEMLNRRV
jgi:hypothetical protein